MRTIPSQFTISGLAEDTYKIGDIVKFIFNEGPIKFKVKAKKKLQHPFTGYHYVFELARR